MGYELWSPSEQDLSAVRATRRSLQGDVEVRRAAVGALRHFRGDVKYTPAGEGTAGHVMGFSAKQQPAHALLAPDHATLSLVEEQSGGLPIDWHALVQAVGPVES